MYYRVYSNCGAVLAKQQADHDPSVGRISVDFVPPPHTAASVIRCISKKEHLDNSKQSQLFISIGSTSPIDGHISMLTSSRPGSTPEDPMALVESQNPINSGPVKRQLQVIIESCQLIFGSSVKWLR